MIALKMTIGLSCLFPGQIAQSVEQRTENPCVAGSIPVLATLAGIPYGFPAFFCPKKPYYCRSTRIP
jgi:hypothetical protein